MYKKTHTNKAMSLHTEAITAYMKFCSDVNLTVEHPHPSMMQMILVFQRNVDNKRTFKLLYPDTFIDWETVEIIKQSHTSYDVGTWVTFMGYVGVQNITPALIARHRILSHFHKAMIQSNLVTDHEHLIKIFLLVHTHNIQVLHAIERYFTSILNRDVHVDCLTFFSLLYNEQFTHEDSMACIAELMQSHLTIDSTHAQQEMELIQTKSKEIDTMFKQKHMRAHIGRPKLRSKLNRLGPDQVFETDRWSTWCENIRFPNVFSITNKKKLYFLMAQTAFDHKTYIHQVLPIKDLQEIVLKFPVQQPDVDILTDCILGTRLTQEPFPEINLFKTECFKSFAVDQKNRLLLNDLLHLYIASYQPPTVWKAVWKCIFPILSIQIIRDIESFVQRHPVNHAALIKIIFERGLDSEDHPSVLPKPPPREEGSGSDLAALTAARTSPHTTEAPDPMTSASPMTVAYDSDMLALQEALAHKLHHTPAAEEHAHRPAQSEPPVQPQPEPAPCREL